MLKLPLHHLTIRVPWHDSGWTGGVCQRPDDNTSCLILPRIGKNRDLGVEMPCRGQLVAELPEDQRPPCVAERVGFMSGREVHRTMRHPYSLTNPEKYGHFAPTPFTDQPWSATCVPFRWMLRETVEGNEHEKQQGLAEALQIDWDPQREPELDFKTSWIQERDNQRAVLDTFFGALKPQESLCFFYAKRTPLSEQPGRVIVGVGRVLSVGQPVEYKYSVPNPPLRCMLWERSVGHSIRPDFSDGFLLPYQAVLAAAADDPGIDPEELVAFAPDETFAAYSYGSEHLTHDGAVSSLVAIAAVLQRLKGRIPGPWDQALAWTDTELNRLWKARGAFPGLGSALSAYGYEWGYGYGTLLGYEIAAAQEAGGQPENPWEVVDQLLSGKMKLPGIAAGRITDTMRKGWQAMPPERRQLLQLLSRCALSEDQAFRLWDRQEREQAGIGASDADLLANPYRFFEDNRASADPVPFLTVDRGMFPDETLRNRFPLTAPSLVDDPADPRRVRAFVASLLGQAAGEGHTLLPRDLVIRQARELALQPPCPLGDAVLDASELGFAPVIENPKTAQGAPAYQLDYLALHRQLIRREVEKRRKGKRHVGDQDWRALIDGIIDSPLPKDGAQREGEQRARSEKAAALSELYAGRLSVLVGPAGTGKTTLIRALLSLENVASGGVLLLAPTGKARVRLEEQTGRRGEGQTLAQFLIKQQRFDYETGRYFVNPQGPRYSGARTVVIDESSMLTEDQLAALFDGVSNVERFILVGDPRQLPPIGAGKPFFDIVAHLKPPNLDATFPKVGASYAELTVPRRQIGADRTDILLAQTFAGAALDPGADEVWERLGKGGDQNVRLVQWTDGTDLQVKIVAELVAVLGLKGPDDELGFDLALGGRQYKDSSRAFFWAARDGQPGAASKAAAWQILSPIHSGLFGVEAINRLVQGRFRSHYQGLSEVPPEEFYKRRIPPPMGSQRIIYGDKVINVLNANRRPKSVYPRPTSNAFIANGDLGIVVGQYKTKSFHGLPKAVEIEFENAPGTKYTFYKWEFGDDAPNPLELAYALTVHKTQGSQFGVTLVVLPNPCRLLSRELLYTALTRHQDRLIIFHQGPIQDLRRLSSDSESEILRRMTNLFVPPSPQELTVGKRTTFLEEQLIHRTERGELVRSKSEVIIADKLHARGIDYAYEQPLILSMGHVRYPDFTIQDQASGVTYYWEHLGLLEDPTYQARWHRKKAAYIAAGILPWQDGGGDNGTLIETRDSSAGGVDSSEIAKVIEDAGLN